MKTTESKSEQQKITLITSLQKSAQICLEKERKKNRDREIGYLSLFFLYCSSAARGQSCIINR